jgi:hypothetical protein
MYTDRARDLSVIGRQDSMVQAPVVPVRRNKAKK